MKYHFQNASICPAARIAFEQADVSEDEVHDLTNAARHIDQAMGILKKGYDLGSLTSSDYDEFLAHIEDAEDILEEIGVLEDHEYIREDLEPRAAELVDVDHVDLTDDALEVDLEENWLF